MTAIVTKTLQRKVSVSLVSLIQSALFRDFYIVTYLHSNVNQTAIVEELLNRFQTYPRSKQQEFIPFLVFVTNKFQNKQIEKWLCKQCQQGDIRLYLMIRWATVSVRKQGENDVLLLDSSVINRKLGCSLDEMTQEEINLWIARKAERSNYLPILNQLYQNIAKVCSKLKVHPTQDRNNKLKQYLQRYLKSFQQKLLQACPNLLYGFDFPHPSSSNYVVNINYEECMCFSTKERVPFKLVFETVDYQELSSYQVSDKGSGSTSSASQPSEKDYKEEDDNVLADNFQDLKTQERDIAAKMEGYLRDKNQQNTIICQRKSEPSKTGLTNPDQEWSETVQRLKESSKFSNFKTLEVRAYIVKSGDDLRQEVFAMQLIKMVQSIFTQFNLKLWVRTYDIMMTSASSGFIEFIHDTTTISGLKKSSNQSLSSIFNTKFKAKEDTASVNFANSLAGYSILQYIFLIKDRHNGNIMLDSDGHIIHIDFGFLLGSSPGNMGFEGAPFKFPKEYLQIMGGSKSDLYTHFKEMLFLGFIYVRRYATDIMKFIEATKDIIDLPCFQHYRPKQMERRFMCGFTDSEIKDEISRLISHSLDSSMTHLYDKFQYTTNTIYY